MMCSRRVLSGGGPGADPGHAGEMISALEHLGVHSEDLHVEEVGGERPLRASPLGVLPLKLSPEDVETKWIDRSM